MAAVSKHAAVIFGLGLGVFASTASAAIPDEDGVIHGCYNQLSGATRIIEGSRCGLFEKAISWSQTGPAGADGASVTGESLPEGDANCPAGGVALTLSGTTSYVCNGLSATDTMEINFATMIIGALPANTDTSFYANQAFRPTRFGTCVYNYQARFENPVPGVVLTPELKLNQNGTISMYHAQTFFPENTGAEKVATATTTGWHVDPDKTYAPGISVHTGDDAIPQGSAMHLTITWICKGGPNTVTL